MTTGAVTMSRGEITSDASNPTTSGVTSQVDWTGRVLCHGRYEIVSRLGEGSMGLVYRAADTRLETDVVIKIPQDRMLKDPEFAERFEREIRSMVKLTHPHVVTILDVGVEDGIQYVVMQYLSGGCLRETVHDQHGKQISAPLSSLRGWVMEVAKALDFIHSQDIIHRDVKPANILFDQHRNAFLSDFGLAKALGGDSEPQRRDASLTAAGFLVGTPNYVAPEMVMGLPSDGKVDQYALAMTVYEVLTGSVPVEGPTASATMVNQTSMRIPPLAEVLPGVPAAVSDAVARGLAKKAEKRFPTCVEFADALLAGLSQGSAPARAPVANPANRPNSVASDTARPGGQTGRTPSLAAKPVAPRAAPVKQPQVEEDEDEELPEAPVAKRKASSGSVPRTSGTVSRGNPGAVPCPHCRKVLPIPNGFGGKKARCAKCFALVQVSQERNLLRLVAPPPESGVFRQAGLATAEGRKKALAKDGADVMLLGEEVFGWRIGRTAVMVLGVVLLVTLAAMAGVIGRQSRQGELEKIEKEFRVKSIQNRE